MHERDEVIASLGCMYVPIQYLSSRLVEGKREGGRDTNSRIDRPMDRKTEASQREKVGVSVHDMMIRVPGAVQYIHRYQLLPRDLSLDDPFSAGISNWCYCYYYYYHDCD